MNNNNRMIVVILSVLYVLSLFLIGGGSGAQTLKVTPDVTATDTYTVEDIEYVGVRYLVARDTPLDTISGFVGAASTTIELTDGIRLNHGLMFIGGATYDLSNTDHATLDNTATNTIITFDAVGFDAYYVILRLR